MLHGTYKFYFHSHQPQNVLGHSGKAKKGHLCFDAIYETGEISRRMKWKVGKYSPSCRKFGPGRFHQWLRVWFVHPARHLQSKIQVGSFLFSTMTSHSQVLVQLFSGQRSRWPADHLQHCQPEQNEKPLHLGPHPNCQILFATQMVREYFEYFEYFVFNAHPVIFQAKDSRDECVLLQVARA